MTTWNEKSWSNEIDVIEDKFHEVEDIAKKLAQKDEVSEVSPIGESINVFFDERYHLPLEFAEWIDDHGMSIRVLTVLPAREGFVVRIR